MNQKYWTFTLALYLIIGCSTLGNVSTNDGRTSAIEKAQHYVNLGKSLAQRRDFNNAKINFLKAAELDPSDYENWGLAGMAAKENSQFDEAIRYFQKAIEVKPSDYKAYGQIGLVSMKQRKYEAAISAFKAVLSLNRTDLEAAARLAEIYYDNGDYVLCEQNMARFEENLSKKNVSLLSDQTKKAIEKTLNAFVNYRVVINRLLKKASFAA